jgi:hypothetical protein
MRGRRQCRQTSRNAETSAVAASGSDDEFDGKTIEKTDAEWKKVLTPEQYYILREAGTEQPYTGKYADITRMATITVPPATSSCSAQNQVRVGHRLA